MCKGFYFLALAGECPLKETEQNFQKDPVITLVSKNTCLKSKLGGANQI